MKSLLSFFNTTKQKNRAAFEHRKEQLKNSILDDKKRYNLYFNPNGKFSEVLNEHFDFQLVEFYLSCKAKDKNNLELFYADYLLSDAQLFAYLKLL